MEVEFRFSEESENDLKLIADGQNIINFTKGSTVKLSQANHHLKFITFKDYNYYETLKNKMIWVNEVHKKEFTCQKNITRSN